MSTDAEANLNYGLVEKLRWQIYAIQLHITCRGVPDRYAKVPICIREKHGQTELRLIDKAAVTTLTLRRPTPLRYNRTTKPNSNIEKPGASSIYRRSRRNEGRNIMRGRIKDVEDVTLTDCLDRCCIYTEEIGYIVFRSLWAKCVGNIAFSKVVMSARAAHLQDPALKRKEQMCVNDAYRF